MNTPTPIRPPDDRIRTMVARLQDSAPTAPAFDGLHSPPASSLSRFVAAVAAVAIIAVGVGGVIGRG